jgi:PKHD-type hydroxylase
MMLAQPREAMADDEDPALPRVFRESLDADECMAVRELHRLRPANRSSLLFPIEDYRRAETWYLSPAEARRAFERMHGIAAAANERYRFDVDAMREPLLLVRYVAGGRFSWHADTGPGIHAHRKISVSIQLSQWQDYDGGGLEFSSIGEPSVARGLGTAIAFPSYLTHRVQPVTGGERWSLVGWLHGPAFR